MRSPQQGSSCELIYFISFAAAEPTIAALTSSLMNFLMRLIKYQRRIQPIKKPPMISTNMMPPLYYNIVDVSREIKSRAVSC